MPAGHSLAKAINIAGYTWHLRKTGPLDLMSDEMKRFASMPSVPFNRTL
jgi:hypothetical protein